MKEDFLHFVWQYQKFAKRPLLTKGGKQLTVYHPGFHNHNAGQDFLDARIKIDDVEWAGNIEIHILSSDWDKHLHQKNEDYDNTILHVVWEYDQEVKTSKGLSLETLELKNNLEEKVFQKYDELLANINDVPCEPWLQNINNLILSQATERSLTSRLERKAEEILNTYESNEKNWQTTTYQTLSKNFGFKVNNMPFLRLSEKLPLKVVQKHASNIVQVEALMFGVAGFLENDIDDEYYNKLKKEYGFLKHKYQLEESGTLSLTEWKFLRLRPANFPTVRIAQLARFIINSPNPFSTFILASSPATIKTLFKITPSPYWLKHYNFKKESKKPMGSFGELSTNNIIINTVAPLLVAYSLHQQDEKYYEKALEILETLKPEKNNITKRMTSLGFENSDAAQSQGIIELYNELCRNKKCLNCSIGNNILNQS